MKDPLAFPLRCDFLSFFLSTPFIPIQQSPKSSPTTTRTMDRQNNNITQAMPAPAPELAALSALISRMWKYLWKFYMTLAAPEVERHFRGSRQDVNRVLGHRSIAFLQRNANKAYSVDALLFELMATSLWEVFSPGESLPAVPDHTDLLLTANVKEPFPYLNDAPFAVSCEPILHCGRILETIYSKFKNPEDEALLTLIDLVLDAASPHQRLLEHFFIPAHMAAAIGLPTCNPAAPSIQQPNQSHSNSNGEHPAAADLPNNVAARLDAVERTVNTIAKAQAENNRLVQDTLLRLANQVITSGAMTASLAEGLKSVSHSILSMGTRIDQLTGALASNLNPARGGAFVVQGGVIGPQHPGGCTGTVPPRSTTAAEPGMRNGRALEPGNVGKATNKRRR
jgi:hypothetical protein